MRAHRLFVAIAVATLPAFSGCNGPSEPSSEQQLLSENRARFRAGVGTSYSYDYRNVCFCGPDTTREVRVSVRDRVRVSVTAVENGALVPRERWNEFLTVEEVFDTIQHAIDEGAASVRVSYDADFGYPKDVFIDFDERLADEERGFILDDLVPAP